MLFEVEIIFIGAAKSFIYGAVGYAFDSGSTGVYNIVEYISSSVVTGNEERKPILSLKNGTSNGICYIAAHLGEVTKLKVR